MFFQNLRIRTKLLVSFSIVILLFIAAITTGVLKINTISQKSNTVYQKNVRPLDALQQIKADYTELRRLTTVIALRGALGEQSEIEKAVNNVNNQYDIFRANSDSYFRLLTEIGEASDNDVNALLTDLNDNYWPIIVEIENNALDGDIDTMMENVTKGGELASKINEEFNLLFAEKMNSVAKNTEDIISISNSSMIILIATSIFATIVSLGLSIFIGRYMSKKIGALRQISKEIAEGNLITKIDTSSKDELGDLSREMQSVVNSFDKVIFSLKDLSEQFERGIISCKIDTSEFKGVYKEMVEKVNVMFATIISDTLAFFNCITEFGNGNFDAVAPEMVGEKVVLEDTVSSIRNKLKSVVGDINSMVSAAAAGELSNRVKAELYDGDWAKMMSSLNQLMEAVATPISEAEAVLIKVAEGNFDTQITGDYKGAFLQIKNSINYMMTNMDSYIGEISDILIALSQNNLNQGITREYVGRFSKIKDALNTIINKLNQMISDISVASEQVALGAKQISESSMTLSEGTTEQAASVEELSATIQAINESTSSNADNAKQADDLSERSKNNAANGDRQMKNMLVAMESIKESSNSISKIIKVIDDIAFQTNLLALNAAVEGARAGIHGKGFAVVAEEVRNLAVRCQEAAKNTAQLIEESINRVNEGTHIADTTAGALQTIVEDVTKVAGIITNIADSSQEQATAISQITESITLITEVVQSNSATSEEAASSSQELLGQSEFLKSLVDIFKLKAR